MPEELLLSDLVAKHGTPLQISFPSKLASNIEKARQLLSKYNWQENLFYSYKTNPVPGVLKVLHQYGAGAEVVSDRELNLALSLGVAPERIVFNGVYKSYQALKTSVDQGIRSINIDMPQELEALDSLSSKTGGRIRVGLRVRPDQGWQGQFGYVMKNGSAFEMARRIAGNNKYELGTIHFHLGSSSLPMYCRAIGETLQFAKLLKKKLGIGIRAIDIGGGFPGRNMRPLTLWEQGWLRAFNVPWPLGKKDAGDGFQILEDVLEYFNAERERHGLNETELWTEPGRLITGDTQILAVRVVGLRRSGGRTYAIADAGRVGAAGPLAGESRKVSLLGGKHMKSETYDIMGPTCMPWDRLFAGIKLPHLEIGDILLIEGAGAYFVPMETEFSFDRPKFVMVTSQKN